MKFIHSGQASEMTIDHLYVAGWTGRDQAAVDHHIAELAEIGISPPSQVPLYYRVTNSLLTHANAIEVLGEGTSGEVEPLLVQQNGKLWLGLASDHTDRELEAHSVACSKQICLKPAAQELWDYDEIKDDLDSLTMSCAILENGEWVIYQQGSLANIRPLAELISASGLGDNGAMLCGTLSAIGGVRPAYDYKMELNDPIRNRQISLSYSVKKLPSIS